MSGEIQVHLGGLSIHTIAPEISDLPLVLVVLFKILVGYKFQYPLYVSLRNTRARYYYKRELILVRVSFKITKILVLGGVRNSRQTNIF